MYFRRQRGIDLLSIIDRALAVYTVRPWQPFAFLLLLTLLLFPLVYGLGGLKQDAGGNSYLPPLASDVSAADFGTTLDSAGKTLVYSLRSVIFVPDQDIRPAGNLGLMAQAFQFILGSLLIALTALALLPKTRQ